MSDGRMQRIRLRALDLWEQAGSPDGGAEPYRRMAEREAIRGTVKGFAARVGSRIQTGSSGGRIAEGNASVAESGSES